VVDRVKEMFCMQPDLMLGSPKPEQIYADAQRNGQRADDCSTKCNRHMRCNDTTSGSNLPFVASVFGRPICTEEDFFQLR
jgi:hypothetical protein